MDIKCLKEIYTPKYHTPAHILSNCQHALNYHYLSHHYHCFTCPYYYIFIIIIDFHAITIILLALYLLCLWLSLPCLPLSLFCLQLSLFFCHYHYFGYRIQNWRVKRRSWLLALLVSWLLSVVHLMSGINCGTIRWLLSVVHLISGCSNKV